MPGCDVARNVGARQRPWIESTNRRSQHLLLELLPIGREARLAPDVRHFATTLPNFSMWSSDRQVFRQQHIVGSCTPASAATIRVTGHSGGGGTDQFCQRCAGAASTATRAARYTERAAA
jgi:hypothetical protein